MGKVAVLEGEGGGGVGLAVDAEGKIAAVGLDSEIDAELEGGRGKHLYYACALPKPFMQVVLLIT